MSDINGVSDAQLLQEIQAGNDGLITEMVVRYLGFTESIAIKYIGSLLEKDDLVQEGLIGLLAAIKSFDPAKGAKFRTYASTCINNSIQNALKKMSRMKDIPPDSLVYIEDKGLDDQYASLSAENEFLAKESVSAFSVFCYERLSRFELEVLILLLKGISTVEIAAKLDKSPKAIENAIQRIRKKLSGVTF